MRIREFSAAQAEVDAFKNFENADMYFEYYPDSYGKERRGSMVPFHFRILCAEISQYTKKHNATLDQLTEILFTVQKV